MGKFYGKKRKRAIMLGLLAVALLLLIAVQFIPSGEPKDRHLKFALDEPLPQVISRLVNAPVDVMRRTLPSLPKQIPDRCDDVFRALLEPDQNLTLRESAIVAWRRSGNADGKMMIELFVRDPVMAIRLQAAAEIGEQSIWESVPVLIAGMRAPEKEIRLAAYGAVKKIFGADFGYRPNDPPEKREAALAPFEANWQEFKPYHDDAMRLREKQRKKAGTP